MLIGASQLRIFKGDRNQRCRDLGCQVSTLLNPIGEPACVRGGSGCRVSRASGLYFSGQERTAPCPLQVSVFRHSEISSCSCWIVPGLYKGEKKRKHVGLWGSGEGELEMRCCYAEFKNCRWSADGMEPLDNRTCERSVERWTKERKKILR